MELFSVVIEDRERLRTTLPCDTNRLPIRIVLLNSDSGETIAYCNLLKVVGSDGIESAGLRSVVTTKEFRGKGWGRKLLRVAEGAATSLAFPCIYVSVMNQDETNAMGFYRHMGYEPAQPYTAQQAATDPSMTSPSTMVFFSKKLVLCTTGPSASTGGHRDSSDVWVDANWLSTVTGQRVQSASIEGMTATGGLSGQLRRIRCQLQCDTTSPTTPATPSPASESTVVLKTQPREALQQSKGLGQPREALFYIHMRAELSCCLPHVYYSFGDMSTGEKFVLMEDLAKKPWVQLGQLYGPGSPLNWGKDLSAVNARAVASGETEATLTEKSFRIAAWMHGTYWMRTELLGVEWLRGTDWLTGKNRESWEFSMQMCISGWKKAKETLVGVNWDPLLVACMDSSCAKASWEKYRERVTSPNSPWTLTHGDFHPGNMMWREGGEMLLLDWEVVGVGNGPQDLSQFVISHVAPQSRRAIEHSAVEKYYTLLLSVAGNKASGYTFEQCWNDYVAGGPARWVWLLALLCGMCPVPMVQYFQDQLAAFLTDHHITPETMEMPRV